MIRVTVCARSRRILVSGYDIWWKVSPKLISSSWSPNPCFDKDTQYHTKWSEMNMAKENIQKYLHDITSVYNQAIRGLSSMLTDLDITNLNLIWRFVIKGSATLLLELRDSQYYVLCNLAMVACSHMTRPLLMICVHPPLPQGQPSLCAAALLQSHSYETVPVPVDWYIKMVAT